jgi:purine-cytosine permease-like protein
VWLGIDLVVAITVSWMPLVADYTRFSRDRRSALVGVSAGYFVAGSWMLLLGAVIYVSRDLSGIEALPAAVAAGGLASALALLAVTVDETDEAFANVYSAAVSLQNLFPRVPQRALIAVLSAVATVGALAIDLRSYEAFLLLLGSFFVPLFGVLLGDWLAAGARYVEGDVFRAPSYRPGLIAAWLVGFALYHWLHPSGPSWWIDLVESVDPIGGDLSGMGGSVPSFAVAFGLALVVSLLGRRARTASATA